MADTAVIPYDPSKLNAKQIRFLKKKAEREDWFRLANTTVEKGGDFFKACLGNPFTVLILATALNGAMVKTKLYDNDIANINLGFIHGAWAATTATSTIDNLFSIVNPFD